MVTAVVEVGMSGVSGHGARTSADKNDRDIDVDKNGSDVVYRIPAPAAAAAAVVVEVDVIIPVHDAADTIDEAVDSAMSQVVPDHLLLGDGRSGGQRSMRGVRIDIAVCCHDDGSEDASWDILRGLQAKYSGGGGGRGGYTGADSPPSDEDRRGGEGGCRRPRRSRREWGAVGSAVRSRLLVGRNPGGSSRGAGYARNRAAELRRKSDNDGDEDEDEDESERGGGRGG